MYLSIFENYEILGNLTQRMNIYNRCGNLFIEILNNYSLIKEKIDKAIDEILKANKSIISNYSKSFLYNKNKISNLSFFYDIVQFELNKIFDDFHNKNRNLKNILDSINEKIRRYK